MDLKAELQRWSASEWLNVAYITAVSLFGVWMITRGFEPRKRRQR